MSISSFLVACTCRWAFVLGAVSPAAVLAPPDLPADPELAEGAPAVSALDRVIAPIEPVPGTPTVELAQAVAMALEGNFNLLASADALREARIRESVSRAQFLPKLTPLYQRALADSGGPSERRFSLEAAQRVPWLNGTFQATGALRTQPLEDPLRGRATDLRLALTQPLLRGFGPTSSFFDLTNNRRAREGQERTFTLAQQSLAVQVAAAFYQVVKQRQLIAVARQSEERSEALMRASEARMKAGLASKLDVYRAELQVSYAQDALQSSETELLSALEDFRVLLGRGPTDALEPAAVVLEDDVQLELEPVSVLVARAFENRVDLHETRDQIDDARRYASLARQNLLPQLDLTVGLTRTGFGRSFGQSFGSLSDNRVDVFLSTSYPIERSSDRAQKAVAEIGLRSRERTLAQRRLEIEAEVRQSVRNMERIAKSVELQKKGVELAAHQHRLSTLRYQRGIASNFDVVEAEDKLVSARATLISLRTDYRVARVRLLQVTGALDLDTEFQ